MIKLKVLFLIGEGVSRGIPETELIERVKGVISALQEKHKIPMVTVGIVNRGKHVSWTQSSPLCPNCSPDPAAEEANVKELKFNIGSLTKAFTSAAVALVLQTERG